MHTHMRQNQFPTIIYGWNISAVFALFLFAALLFGTLEVNATSTIWTNGNGTNTWNDAFNWSSGVPISGDTAIFNGTSTAACNIDVDVAIEGILIEAGYSGTITQQAGSSISLDQSFDQAAGTFVGGSDTIFITRNLGLSGGSFTSTSGILEIQRNLTIQAGVTFAHNNGTILATGNSDKTYREYGSAAFYTFVSSIPSNRRVNLNNADTIDIVNELVLVTGEVRNGTINLGASANLDIRSTYGGGTTEIQINSAGTINIPTTQMSGIILNHASCIVNMGVSNINFEGDIVVQAGTFNGGSDTIRISQGLDVNGGTCNLSSGITYLQNTINVNAGTLNHNNGLLSVTGNANSTINANGNLVLNDLDLDVTSDTRRIAIGAGDTVTLNGHLHLINGLFNGGYLSPAGTFAMESTFDGGTGELLVTAATTINLPASDNMIGFALSHPSAVINTPAGDSITFAGSIEVNNGTFNSSNSKVVLEGSLILNGGLFNATTDTMVFATRYCYFYGGTFNHNNGTVWTEYTGQNFSIYPETKPLFYNFVINQSNPSRPRFLIQGTNDTMRVANNLTIITADVHSGFIEVQGQLVTEAGYVPGSNSGFIFANGSGARTINLTAASYPDIAINDADITVNAPSGIDWDVEDLYLINGVLNLSSGQTTLSRPFYQTGGTLNGGSGKIVVSNVFEVTGGSFNSTTDTLSFVHQNITFSAGVFTHNNGTVEFARANNMNLNLTTSVTMNDVIQQQTSSGDDLTISSGDTLVVLGHLELVNGDINTGVIEVRGTMNNNSDHTGGSGVMVFANGPSRTIDINAGTLPDLYIEDANVTVNGPSSGTLNISGPFTLTEGVYNNGAGTLTPTSLIINDGVFNLNSGSISYSNDVYVNGGTLNSNTGTIGIRTLILNDGNINLNTGILNLSTDLIIYGGVLDAGASILDINRRLTQTGGAFSGGASVIDIADRLVVSSGTFTSTSDTLTLTGGTFTIGNPNSFLHNNGTLLFYRDNNVTVGLSSSANLHNVIIDLVSDARTLSIGNGDTMYVENDLQLLNGNVNSGYLVAEGNIGNISAFSGGSTILLISGGSGSRTINLGASNLPDIYINDPLVTVNAPASGTVTIEGVFNMSDGVFNGGGSEVVVQGNITFSGGTLNAGAGRMSTTGNFTQTGGVYNGSGSLELAGSFAVSGTGTQFVAPSDTLLIDDAFTLTSPATFSHNNGTVMFDGTGNENLTYTGGTSLNLFDLIIAIGPSEQDLNPRVDLDVDGDLILTGAARLDLDANNVDVSIAGDYIVNSTRSDVLAENGQTVTFDGSSQQTISHNGGEEIFYNLVNSNTSGGVVQSSTGVYITNQVTLTPASNAKFILNDNIFNVGSSATISGGSNTEYFVTNGEGQLRQEGMGATGRSGGVLFPVGPTTSSYTPITIANGGTDDGFAIKVKGEARGGGWDAGVVKTFGAIELMWDIDEVVDGGSDVDFTIQWNADNELPGFNRENMIIQHFTGGAWTATQDEGAASGSGPYTKSTTGITSFSPFGGDTGGALPVELGDFDAQPSVDGVQVTWFTYTETNNDYYTLERSVDAETYDVVATIQGGGNSTVALNYSHTDKEPLPGVSYYRLIQTDYDGQFEVFDPVVVRMNTSSTTVNVTPNPADGNTVTVNVDECEEAQMVRVNLKDSSGKTVYSSGQPCTGGQADHQIDIDHLPGGMYFLQSTGTTINTVKRLIIK